MAEKYKYEDKDSTSIEGRFHGVGETRFDMLVYKSFATWILKKNVSRYRKRFWRESVFQGMVGVRQALDDVYGVGKVTMVSAAFRWLNHHSFMKQQYNGMMWS